MSIESFNKENLDAVLKNLAKEYRKLGGKAMPAEIILIGGAAVIENYGFRDMTTDVDAVIEAASMLRDAVRIVADRMNLPDGWLNDDFRQTDSYSSRLGEVSVFYRSFYGVLNVRTVSAEYLVAMKLKSGRKYKNDLSDVVGILAEHKREGRDITRGQLDAAMQTLYGGWEQVPKDSLQFIENLMKNGDYESVYREIRDNEKQAKELLLDFTEKYPGAVNTDNADNILSMLKARKNNNPSNNGK